MKINEFFEDYVYYVNYDNFQSIASYIDGFKPTARKLFYTYYNYIKKGRIKISQLGNKMAELTEYISGENSANGVIINLAKNFPVSGNNINLFEPDGYFGDRFAPNSSAAPRYIFIRENSLIKFLFLEEDFPLLKKLKFEGKEIEYKFYIPIIPMILVNRKIGIGNGFAQNILPRHPQDIINVIKEYLIEGTIKEDKIVPYFNGFKGTFEYDSDGKWICKGNIIFKNKQQTEIEINELPINYSLTDYIKILEKLKENNIINSYTDLSENNQFNFIVKVKRNNENKDYWLEKLKLITTLNENFTCMDEEYKIIIFDNEINLIKDFIDFRLKYYTKRKEYLLKKYQDDYNFYKDRINFIKLILDGKLIIYKRKIDDILNDCKKQNIKFANKHLEMKITSFTKEKLEELKNMLNVLKLKIEELENKTEKELYLDDLNKLESKMI